MVTKGIYVLLYIFWRKFQRCPKCSCETNVHHLFAEPTQEVIFCTSGPEAWLMFSHMLLYTSSTLHSSQLVLPFLLRYIDKYRLEHLGHHPYPPGPALTGHFRQEVMKAVHFRVLILKSDHVCLYAGNSCGHILYICTISQFNWGSDSDTWHQDRVHIFSPLLSQAHTVGFWK